eukprot:TRINITY_DN1332_c0_g1_i1.p1 TRINITY_DN1332_c0_g1~~TRINITY_DN1332_c0_g1_i1.p1  ORF type:complete len:177 (-),score=51.70 TRINITY_DN1332_c0_g1_i1:80-610(-)
MSSDNLEQRLRATISAYPDFPSKGVLFRDISPIIADAKLFSDLTNSLIERYRGKVDVIVGLEARGFIFGPPIAMGLNVPFVMLRKKGKLPGQVVRYEYQKEYGTDIVEIQVGSIQPGQRVLLVDDLIATGGTAKAGASLVEKVGGKISEFLFIIELADLKGRDVLGDTPIHSVLVY